MEIQQARYFVALCETLNFTRAAERCNVTQPSLTRAIRLLEDELGGSLFNRERNRSYLTELGRLVEPHVREVVSQARAFFRLSRARLRLGVTRGLPLAPLEGVLWRYAAAYPETGIEIQDGPAGELRETLREGGFEVVVLPLRPPDVDDLHYHALAEHRLRLVVPADHPLAARAAVPLAELAGLPLLCGAGCSFWEAAERQLAGQGLEVRPRAVAGSEAWLHELVAAGVGVGLGAGTGPLPEGLVGRPVEAPAIGRPASLATKRGRLYSPPVKAFVDLALQRYRPQPAADAA